MRTFAEIFEIAAARKGGADVLEQRLERPRPAKQLAALPDDRWLSMMTKCVFQAGFNWKVVDNMWPGFEAAFSGFDVNRCALLNDDDVAMLVSDKRIVRHGVKIRSVIENAAFVGALTEEHGSAGNFFAAWPADDYVGLLRVLKKRGARLGGNTGQYFLRFMGVDSFVLSRDVTARLVAEGVVDGTPASQKALRSVQDAFNGWRAESGRSLTEISRVLALSVD